MWHHLSRSLSLSFTFLNQCDFSATTSLLPAQQTVWDFWYISEKTLLYMPCPLLVASPCFVLDSILAHRILYALIFLCFPNWGVNYLFSGLFLFLWTWHRIISFPGAFAVPYFRTSTWQVQLETQWLNTVPQTALVLSRFQSTSVIYYPISPSLTWIVLLHRTYHWLLSLVSVCLSSHYAVNC